MSPRELQPRAPYAAGASESHRCSPGSSRRAPLRRQCACAWYRRTPCISSTYTPKSRKATAARRRPLDTSSAHGEHDVRGRIQARQTCRSSGYGASARKHARRATYRAAAAASSSRAGHAPLPAKIAATSVPLTLERVARLTSHLDSCTRAQCAAAGIRVRARGYAARGRERYTEFARRATEPSVM